jgi:hypothetical protein
MPRERLSTAAPLQHSTTAHMATPATPATPLSRDRIPACPAITLKCRLGKKEFFLFFEGVVNCKGGVPRAGSWHRRCGRHSAAECPRDHL